MLELFQAIVLIIVGLFVWYLEKGLDNKKRRKNEQQH